MRPITAVLCVSAYCAALMVQQVLSERLKLHCDYKQWMVYKPGSKDAEKGFCSICSQCKKGTGRNIINPANDTIADGPLGYGAESCVPCRPCLRGMYNTGPNMLCRNCRDCEAEHRNTLKQCTLRRNTICGSCKAGYFDVDNNNNRPCKRVESTDETSGIEMRVVSPAQVTEGGSSSVVVSTVIGSIVGVCFLAGLVILGLYFILKKTPVTDGQDTAEIAHSSSSVGGSSNVGRQPVTVLDNAVDIAVEIVPDSPERNRPNVVDSSTQSSIEDVHQPFGSELPADLQENVPLLDKQCRPELESTSINLNNSDDEYSAAYGRSGSNENNHLQGWKDTTKAGPRIEAEVPCSSFPLSLPSNPSI